MRLSNGAQFLTATFVAVAIGGKLHGVETAELLIRSVGGATLGLVVGFVIGALKTIRVAAGPPAEPKPVARDAPETSQLGRRFAGLAVFIALICAAAYLLGLVSGFSAGAFTAVAAGSIGEGVAWRLRVRRWERLYRRTLHPAPGEDGEDGISLHWPSQNQAAIEEPPAGPLPILGAHSALGD